MFIQTEATPNPATLKFLPGREVLGGGEAGGGMDFPNADAAAASPLAQAVFATDGVASVFLGGDFLSVTKTDGVDWAHLKPAILGAIMDHFTAGLPVLADGAGAPESANPSAEYEGEDAEVVEQIVELLDTRVRPAVAQDGGDIVFDRYEPGDGVVYLHMRGACSGCPSSTMTLKAGIENLLKHYIPEINRVEPVL
ncbi:MAG: NifU family protein [Pseudomonadota bacterium]